MNEPIRILHVLGRTDRGGAESLVMSIYRNIDREKIQFDFAIHTNDRCDFDDEIESLGGNIYHLPKYRIYNHLCYKKAWNDLLTENCFQAVHGHMNSTASIYLSVAKEKEIPTISHIHNINGEGGVKSLIKSIYKKNINNVADYKFACSNDAGHWMYGKDENDFTIIKNGIEVEKFLFNKDVRVKKRKELGLSDDEILIGHIGNYRPVKNHKFILEVFREVYNQDNNYKLAFVGSGVKENVDINLKNPTIKNNILFLGSRTDVNELLQAFDIFILPSIYEGLPVSLVEAQASDLLCIVSSRVAKESDVTGKVKFLPIDDNVSNIIWAKEITNYSLSRRENMGNKLSNLGYNIKDTAQYLSDFYEQLKV